MMCFNFFCWFCQAEPRRILANLYRVIANPVPTEEVCSGLALETEVAVKHFLRQSGTRKSRELIW